jgi:hypothetical protein
MNLPEGKIATLLNDTYNAHVSVVDYLKKAAELFGDEYERIKREMRESLICNYDDTGLRVDGSNRWLWAFVSKEAVLYLTSKNRGKKVVIFAEKYRKTKVLKAVDDINEEMKEKYGVRE